MSSVWNEEDFLKRTKGKPERAHRLITLYLKEIPKEVDALLQAIEAEDIENTALHAHAVKGVSSNISAPILVEDMQNIESACRNSDTEAMKKLATKSAADFEDLKTTLAEYLSQLG